MKKIAIIGKKNVGKSSLFNLLTRSNDSVNINYSGYTRDSNFKIIKFYSSKCQIIDTAGLGYERSEINYITLKKTWLLIKNVDILIYLSEVNSVLNYLEKNILTTVNNLKQTIIHVVNKIDLINEEYSLSNTNKNVIFISVKKKIGINVLISKLIKLSKDKKITVDSVNKIKISVVGRANAGKSTLVNKLTRSNSVIVWDKPGTTRDNIKLYAKKHNKIYEITDTPGIKKNTKTRIDQIFTEKSIESIKLSDIPILLVDASVMLTKLDNFLLNIKNIHSYIVIFNKCDLIKKSSLIALEEPLIYKSRFNYLFVSSKHSFGINRIFKKIDNIKHVQEKKIKKDKINSIIDKSIKTKKLIVRSTYPLIIDVYFESNIKKNHEKYIKSLIIKNFRNDNIDIKIKKF